MTTRKTAPKKPTSKTAAKKKPVARRKPAASKKMPSKSEPAKSAEPEQPFGALVGWASDDLGNRIRLRMQSTRSTPKSPADIEEFHYYMDKDQAVTLANFLFRVSGHTAPEPAKPKWLRKLIG